MLKKIVTTALALLLISPFMGTKSFASDTYEPMDVMMMVDKNAHAFQNQKPFLMNGRMMVPLRELLVALGVPNDDKHIEWEANKTINVVKGGKRLSLKIGSPSLWIKEKTENKMDVYPMIYDGSTYLPARGVAEALGYKVEYDSDKHILIMDEVFPDHFDDYPNGKTEDSIVMSMASKTTSDSHYVLKGTVPDAKEQEITVILQKVGSDVTQSEKFVTKNKQFEYDLGLYDGSGTYKVSLLKQNSDEKKVAYTLNRSFNVTNTDTKDWSYLKPVNGTTPEVVDLAKQITNGLKDEYEKVKAVHDWVTRTVAYDTYSYYKGVPSNYNPVDVITNKTAVCAGYTNLNKALLRSLGIKTRAVSGTAIWASFGETWENTQKGQASHAWNEVFVNNRWIIVDTTWDAGYINGMSFTFHHQYKYFDPTPETFAIDHRAYAVEKP